MSPVGAWHRQGVPALPRGAWPSWIVHPSPRCVAPAHGCVAWAGHGLRVEVCTTSLLLTVALCLQGSGVCGCQWGDIQLLNRLGCSRGKCCLFPGLSHQAQAVLVPGALPCGRH